MNTYRFHVAPQLTYKYPGVVARQLTVADISRTLLGSTVQQIAGTPTTGYGVVVQLGRASHPHALHDIRVALEQLGFAVVQAEITEWLTATLELALIGGTGGGALGSATKDPGIVILGAAIGFAAGAIAAQFTKKVKARFDAQLVHPYGPHGWSVTPQIPPGWSPSPHPA